MESNYALEDLRRILRNSSSEDVLKLVYKKASGYCKEKCPYKDELRTTTMTCVDKENSPDCARKVRSEAFRRLRKTGTDPYALIS